MPDESAPATPRDMHSTGRYQAAIVQEQCEQKKPAHSSHCAQVRRKSRRRPTLPPGCPGSTIGSKKLNFRVRYGIGCDLLDITTGNLWVRPIGTQRRPLLAALYARPAVSRCSSPELRARRFDVCLRSMVKPHDLLVPVSSADCSTSTPGLSTTWSRWGL